MTDTKLSAVIKTSKAPAIARASAILRLLGKSESPLSLQTIARELGLVPSTCLYVLRALVAEELVAFIPDTKRYTLDAGVLTLARQWLRRNDFSDLAQPVLDRLAHSYGVTMLGVQIFGLDHIITVAVAQAGSYQLSVQVGSRFPALLSATGRCIAAYGDSSETELAKRFETLRWENPPSYAEWKMQIEETRKQGFGVDEGNYISGITVIAAPIWKDPGQLTYHPSHALVALGVGSSFNAKRPELEQELLLSAQSLTRQMGGETPNHMRQNQAHD